MPADYEVFQRPRPNWFSVNHVYHFSSPQQEGSEVYDGTGAVISTEEIEHMTFRPYEKGGLIVFSTTSMPSLFLARLTGQMVAFLKSWDDRWQSLTWVGRAINRFHKRTPARKNLWFSIGCFYLGSYSSLDPFYRGKDFKPRTETYDATCLTVQIVGLTQQMLLDLATSLACQFRQREVLVFDLASSTIFTVNRRNS